jgi:TPR repeat protein
MRWRVNDIPADVRKMARDAAKAAGLPLGSWLDRAILQSQRESPAVPPAEEPTHAASSALGDASSETPELSPVNGHAREIADENAPAASAAGHDIRSGAMARQTPAKLRNLPSLLASRRVKIVLAAASAAIVAGAIALWHLSPATRDAQQAADPTQSSSPRAQEPRAQPSTPPQSQAGIVEELQRDAENGDAMAQHDLALAYLNGRGVAQNYQTAAEWFEKAAEAGLERAQFNLAVLYENALGVPEDLERAFKLYSAAAEQGFGPAQHNLAVAYAQGRGTSRDYQAAALWFRRAAVQGIASAQYNLGMIYEKGLASAPDEQTAYGWYRMAAASGSEAAVARLAAIEGRIATAPTEAKPGPRTAKPTVAEVAEIQRLLSLLSFNPGAADGKTGKATREAIRQYQQVAGLPVNGEPSQTLLTHLRQVTGIMRSGGR